MIMEAGKPQDLQANWIYSRSHSVSSSQKPAALKPKRSPLFSSNLKVGKKKSMSQFK